MAKPRKIVLASDGEKKFNSEVFEMIRTVLALQVGGNVNLGVKLAAEAFAPRMPASVTAEELKATIPAIVAKFAAESAKKQVSDGRLPFDDEMQKDWDAGLYKGQVTVRGIFERFAKEIKDGVNISKSMFLAYIGDLKAEKAAIVALVDEKPDPDSGPVDCAYVAHRGDARLFQPNIAFKLIRNSAGRLERQKHSQGDDFIVVGHFVVLKDEAGEVTGETEAYCAPCREAARAMVREAKERADTLRHQLVTAGAEEKSKLQKALAEVEVLANTKLTFYTTVGAQRVISAARRNAETDAAAMQQIRRAAGGARMFNGSYGTRKNKRDWRVARGGK